MLHEVTVASLTIDPEAKTPVLLLKTVDSDIAVPIMIGLLEASSIISAIQNIEYDRPMTHDLFTNYIEKMDMKLSKIEITDIIDNTFYAKIYFISKKKDFFIDARPSDAIAMALRANARMYIEDKVIGKSKPNDKNFEEIDKTEEGKKWTEYLKNLDPDDFGKYKV